MSLTPISVCQGVQRVTAVMGGSLRGCAWQQRFVCTASEGGELGGKGCQLSRCHAEIIATCGAEGNIKGQTSVIPEAAFTPGGYRSSASTKARAGLWAVDVGQPRTRWGSSRKPERKFTAGLGKVSLAWPPRASTSHREV